MWAHHSSILFQGPRYPLTIIFTPIDCCCVIPSCIIWEWVMVVYSLAPVVYVVSAWTKAVRTPFGIFCCFFFTTSCVSISSRLGFMVGCGHLSIWLIVLLVQVHPGYWLGPVLWCLIWPIGNHPCIILHVCICLVLGRLRRWS